MKEILILSTTSTHEEAEKIATILIESRFAACCNIIPGLTSIYIWEEKVVNDKEFLMLIKTTEAELEQVIETIKQHHSYTLPEIIAFDIKGGYTPYLNWIRDSTSP